MSEATKKKTSSSQWHAFLQHKEAGPGVVTAHSQKELKKFLGMQDPNTQVLAIVKGKSFGFKIQKSFEFVTPTASEEKVVYPSEQVVS